MALCSALKLPTRGRGAHRHRGNKVGGGGRTGFSAQAHRGKPASWRVADQSVGIPLTCDPVWGQVKVGAAGGQWGKITEITEIKEIKEDRGDRHRRRAIGSSGDVPVCMGRGC